MTPCLPAGRLNSRSKLSQKSYVVFTEKTDVIDAILQKSRTFNAHTKRKAGVFVWINTTILQHIGMHHAAAKNFKPAGIFANTAAFTFTKCTTNVHFGAGLSKRKK